jgi:hypothetical protein
VRKNTHRGSVVLAFVSLLLVGSGCSVFPSSGSKSSTTSPIPAASVHIYGSITPQTAGVTIALRGPSSASAITDASGNYSFSNLRGGIYSLTPSKGHSAFNPPNHLINVADGDVTRLNFAISDDSPPVGSFNITGIISPAAYGAGASVTLVGSAYATTTADDSGHFAFASVPEGVYWVVPNKSDYEFDPPRQNAVVASGNVTGINFIATKETEQQTYSISGNISPVAGGSHTTVSLTGATNASTITDDTGNFRFTNLPNGTYKVTPTKDQYTFNPSSRTTTVSSADIAGLTFVASKVTGPPPTYSISGKISPTVGGTGATVQLSGSADASTITDTFGNYSFSGLASGTYKVTPSKVSYTFSPSNQTETIDSSNVAGVNFTVSSSAVSGVPIHPGQDIADIVSVSPAGTTFVIYPGTYRLTKTIVPKDGDIFIGQTACAPPNNSCPAVISGSIDIGSRATFDGKNYRVMNQAQHGGRGASGICDKGWEGCIYPEDLFFDGVPYKHLSSATLPEIGPGQWWFDYSNHAIYFHDNPSGHVVETSVLKTGFGGSANNVTLQYLTVKEFANMYPYGAIGTPQGNSPQKEGANWTVQNCEILLNHGDGVRVGYGIQILNNYIHDNGQLGVGGGIGSTSAPSTGSMNSGILIQGNVINHNDYAHFDPEFGAGGVKIGSTSGVTLRGNTIQNNEGSGIHFDMNGQSEFVDGNIITDNSDGDGLVQEIGYGTSTFRNNILLRNGKPVYGNNYTFQIGVDESSGVEAYCNVMEIPPGKSVNGWGVNASNRGYSQYPPYQYLASTGNSFHHNTVIWDEGATGVVGFIQNDTANQPDLFARNARPDFSTYYLSNLSAARFVYDNPSQTNRAQNFSTYQTSRGDVHGAVDSSYSAGYPRVQITSPADQSAVGNAVRVSATAADSTGISKVEFYVDWNLQGTATAPPYNFNWNGISGAHTVAAVAYSNAGVKACHAVSVSGQ